MENAEGTTYTIKVKEYQTNTSLPGVQIKLYECSRYDIEFGCQSTALYSTHTTDDNGEYIITQKELNRANEGIILSKLQYWDITGGTGENHIEPEAWTKVTLTRGRPYPDTCFFRLTTTSKLGISSSLSFTAPMDSIVNFRLFGNETNQIYWIVYSREICPYYCTRDTLAFGTFSLSPQRFETLTSSVTY